MERDAFLARVRDRLSGVVAPPLPSELPGTFASGDGRLYERFAQELGAVGGEPLRLRESEVADAIAELATGTSRAVVARDVPARAAVEAGLARAGCAAAEPSREEAEVAGLGITGAELGVASTGSVLVRMGPGAPRVASLLPPLHVCLLAEERIVPGFEELFAALPAHASASAQTVLITGPSRTSDIERTLVWGVHGPIRVAVLVIAA